MGRIVVYRTRDGVDVPAIITAVIDEGRGAVHLQPFVPPGVSPDTISYQWGVPYDDPGGHSLPLDADGRARACWRWPERS